MPTVKSLEDLNKIRAEALKRREQKPAPGGVQIVVGIGLPGIAAGVRDTLKEIVGIIEENHLSNVTVRQTSNSGLDAWEPVVQILKADEEPVAYWKVTPAVARRIMEEHVMNGKVVSEYVIPA